MDFIKKIFGLSKEEDELMDKVRGKYNLKPHSNIKVLNSDIGISVLKSELGNDSGDNDVLLLNLIDKNLNKNS